MHLTDEQLNEYLDYESVERAQIESHLTECDECAARLTALQALFVEIESLPELDLTRDLAARFAPTSSLTTQLPRWLTLTATLQAALALIAMIAAAPFVANLMPEIETPSLTDVFIQIQSQWAAWLDRFTEYQLPTIPELPAPEISGLALMLALAGASLLWLVGNGLLLRNYLRRQG